jgi:Fe-S cluster assembly protein SufD
MMDVEYATLLATCEKALQAIAQDDPLAKLRLRAWEHFSTVSLPTRQTQGYQSIKLRHLYGQTYELPANQTATELTEAIYPECRHAVLVFVNGVYQPQLSQRQAIPDKVVITSLPQAMRTYGTFLHNHWTKSLKEELDPFVILNSALHPLAAFMYVPPKVVIETPIQILHVIQGNEPLLLMPRLQVFMGAQSEASFLTTSYAPTSTPALINQVLDWSLEENAHVHVTQALDTGSTHIWQLEACRAYLKKNATFKTVAVTHGSATTRSDYRVALCGENAEVLLNGVWMLKERLEAHVNVLVDHQAPHCRSHQLFKGVLHDHSRSSFEGKILVRQPAQKTQAFQLNHNLILNEYAHADSRPNLEIFADDVKASHGATIGQLDIEQLFYLKTRGLSDQDAKRFLLTGFCDEVFNLIKIPSFKERLAVL